MLAMLGIWTIVSMCISLAIAKTMRQMQQEEDSPEITISFPQHEYLRAA